MGIHPDVVSPGIPKEIERMRLTHLKLKEHNVAPILKKLLQLGAVHNAQRVDQRIQNLIGPIDFETETIPRVIGMPGDRSGRTQGVIGLADRTNGLNFSEPTETRGKKKTPRDIFRGARRINSQMFTEPEEEFE